MAGNALIAQGTLNRLLASVQFISLAQLNITKGLLAPEMITIAPEDVASDYLGTQVGAVQSGRPFQIYNVTVHLLKSQSLCEQWEQQRLTNTNIGDFVVYPDSPTMNPRYYSNGVLSNINEIQFSGTTVDFPLMLRGTYNINSALFV